MKLGKFEVQLLSAGHFALDGGSMFGIVPRVIWSRLIAPDERNRIPMGTNVLLIRTPEANILVDTGIGDIWNEKFRDIYAIRPFDPLRDTGLRPEEIDIVILTHLHFDHTGGSVVREGETYRPRYPNATYFVHALEWEDATHPNERTRASYVPETFQPLMEAGKLRLNDDYLEVVPGVRIQRTGGHTRGHQIVWIESEGQLGVFLADITPMIHHVPYPYIMGYDLFPLDTLRVRKEIYPVILKRKAVVFFEHDREPKVGTLGLDERGRPVYRPLGS